MKALNFIKIILLSILCSCNSGLKTNGHKVTFGIHEIVKKSEIPNSIIDTLKSKNVQIESNRQQSEIGYITKADSMVLQLDLSEQNIKLIKTRYPVDKEQKYYAVVAIRPSSIIYNSDIKKTKVSGKDVEIYFNMEGANKWADLTKQNIGNTVVFVVDNQVCSFATISSEILNGISIINGLNNEDDANNISESLNSSLSK